MTRHPARRRARLAPIAAAGAFALALGACSTDGGEVETPSPDPDAAEQTTEAPTESAPDLQAARDGLARYLEANRPATPQTSTNIPGCPALELGDAEAALADVGFGDISLGGWSTEIEWDEYETISPELLGIACGGDSDGDPNDSETGTALGIAAVDLAGFSDVEGFFDVIGTDAEAVDSETGSIAGDRYVLCYPEEGCLAFWHDDGLVLAVGVLGGAASEEQSLQLLDAQVPTILRTLAEG